MTQATDTTPGTDDLADATISVCIATYKRTDRLGLLMGDLRTQARPPTEVIIADNDPAGSARAIAETAGTGAPFRVIYTIQPEQNIALTRNESVAHATGDWIAFVDDDERVTPDWLERLMQAVERYHADGVLGPVLPVIPDDAPAWIRRGRFYDFERSPSGEPVGLNLMRFGNVILRGSSVRRLDGPFDPAYGLRTGEDGDMLLRMVEQGDRIVWCDESVLYEPIEPSRLRLGWLVQRALSGGQEYARKRLAGRYGASGALPAARLFLEALAKAGFATVLIPITLPLGRHQSGYWLTRASANLGKLSVFFGYNYAEYASTTKTQDSDAAR